MIVNPTCLVVVSLVLNLQSAGFLFDRELEDRSCVRWEPARGDALEFCILAVEGAKYGILPAVRVIGKDGKATEIWRDKNRGFSPWKLLITELDGDPLPEIALGVIKKTRHDTQFVKRLFIYDWTGSCLFPKWLGSSLALPLDDFTFIVSGKGKLRLLVTLESRPGGKLIRSYRWNGFGFTGVETHHQTGPGVSEREVLQSFERMCRCPKNR